MQNIADLVSLADARDVISLHSIYFFTQKIQQKSPVTCHTKKLFRLMHECVSYKLQDMKNENTGRGIFILVVCVFAVENIKLLSYTTSSS